MPSSSDRAPRIFASVVVVSIAGAWASAARAQAQPDGFAVERFYSAAPGSGWMVLDSLDMRGGLGGVIALTAGYAHAPLRVATSDGSQRLTVVSDQAFADVGLAITYDRYRLYLDLRSPLVIAGNSGAVGNVTFDAPSVNIAKNPDTLSDPRVGFDARLLGDATSPLRLGAGAQLFLPEGARFEYDSDGTPRAMVRAHLAGDAATLSYAAQLGVHVRPLDDFPAPGSPQGSELLYAAAAGTRFPISGGANAILVGGEIYGESAFRSFLQKSGTDLEALITSRFEGILAGGPLFRVKLGVGGGILARFGAPEWRVVWGIEYSASSSTAPPPNATTHRPQ
jgi:hypothetical protein